MKTLSDCSNFNRIAVAFLLFLALGAVARSQKGVTDTFTGQKEAAIVPNSESRIFHSELFDQDFMIFIQLPMSYNSDSAKLYPVMYITDANRNFPLVANISILLGFPKTDFPEVAVVGIGYKIEGMEDWAAWRTRDLTPTIVPATDRNTRDMLLSLSGRDIDVTSGGSEKFLNFMMSELIPFVESEYHFSKSERALGGYSYGGLFTMYALFRQPGAFRFYFAGSPSLAWNNGVIFRYEEDCSKNHTTIDAKVFITAGSLEGKAMLSNVDTLKSRLLRRNYPGLTVDSHIFEGETHVSCYPSAFMRAFTNLYK